MQKDDISSKEYWNERVKSSDSLENMLFRDGRRNEYWRRVRQQLGLWKDLTVIDLCCGFGQFSDIFKKYKGVDFSEEMIKLANEKNKGKTFICKSINEVDLRADVIFEVNSLHSLGMELEEFVERFEGQASIIACLEADFFYIKQGYGGR